MRLAVILLSSLPLAGCMGVTLPSQPVPDWAMSQHVENEPSAAPRTRTTRRVATTYRAPADYRAPDRSANASYTANGSYAVTGSVARDDVKPFSPEWHSRENALDARVRRSMDICRGC